MLVGNCSVFGFLGNVTYGLFGLAEEGVAPGLETDAVTSCLSGLQKPDGSWEGGDARPPLAGRNPFVYTALAVRGLTVYPTPLRRVSDKWALCRWRNLAGPALNKQAVNAVRRHHLPTAQKHRRGETCHAFAVRILVLRPGRGA